MLIKVSLLISDKSIRFYGGGGLTTDTVGVKVVLLHPPPPLEPPLVSIPDSSISVRHFE